MNLEKKLFYLFLFSIPFQKRLILWRWAEPFNEWAAGYLYFSDILLVTLLTLWFFRSGKSGLYDSMVYHKAGWFLTAFAILSLISVFYAAIPRLALFRSLKLIEFILFYFYLKANWEKIFNIQVSGLVIIASGVFQALIGINQYLRQASLGFRLFGESPLSIDLPNTAVFLVGTQKILRAYGTTPHPNILAVWLFLAIFVFYFWFANFSGKYRLRSLLAYSLILWGFLLTFSRVIIGLWLLMALFLWLKNKSRKKFKPLLIVSLAVLVVFSLFYWPQVQNRFLNLSGDEAFEQRLYYNKLAVSLFKKDFWLGGGTGQFVTDLMEKFKYRQKFFYQPVHNVYLLIASENGLIGLMLFLLFLFFSYKKALKLGAANYCLLTAVLVIALFDHFFWTLQQGSLVFWLTLVVAQNNLSS